MKDNKIKLIHRLNRASGQIESLKKTIASDTPEDCLKTLQQLKASINALKKFGESYIVDHMQNCLNTKHKSKKEIESIMKDVIKSSFSL